MIVLLKPMSAVPTVVLRGNTTMNKSCEELMFIGRASCAYTHDR